MGDGDSFEGAVELSVQYSGASVLACVAPIAKADMDSNLAL